VRVEGTTTRTLVPAESLFVHASSGSHIQTLQTIVIFIPYTIHTSLAVFPVGKISRSIEDNGESPPIPLIALHRLGNFSSLFYRVSLLLVRLDCLPPSGYLGTTNIGIINMLSV